MEEYLRDIKVIAGSLAAIANPLSRQELVHYTLFMLDGDHEGLITIAAYFGGNLTLMIFVLDSFFMSNGSYSS